MVRADIGAAGVMFSIDTETGFDKVVLINAAWGLGETVVQGTVDPDEYLVYKPLLADSSLSPIVEKRLGGKAQKMIYGRAGDLTTRNVPTSKDERGRFVLADDEILMLGRWAASSRNTMGGPWTSSGPRTERAGELFIVQARPETVQSRRATSEYKTYRINSKGRKLLSGLAIGDAVVTGNVCLLESARDIDRFVDGAVLVTSTTDPGLGPDHEKGGGYRHRPWRANLARRDRQPRARRPSRRRHWQRHARSP